MGAGLTPDRAESALQAIAGDVWVQLHTGPPGANGLSNIAGEATRKQATLTGDNPLSNGGTLVWDPVSTSEIITHVTGWDAASSGSCGWVSDALDNDVADRTLTAGDRFTIDAGALSIEMPTAS